MSDYCKETFFNEEKGNFEWWNFNRMKFDDHLWMFEENVGCY